MRIPFVRVLICVLIFGVTLYVYIDQKNRLTELRLMIPKLERNLNVVREENVRLKFEVERFENPHHLLELSRKPEYGHLKYPKLEDVVIIDEDGL